MVVTPTSPVAVLPPPPLPLSLTDWRLGACRNRRRLLGLAAAGAAGTAAAYAVYKWWYAEGSSEGSEEGSSGARSHQEVGVLLDPRGPPATTQMVSGGGRSWQLVQRSSDISCSTSW